MTVPSTTRRAGPFTGTGALVAYPFTFKVFAKQDLAVTIADANGLETDLVLDSTFTVTLNVDQEATPGGTVNYAVGGVATALPSGHTLVVTGDGLEFEQTADLPQGGNFSPVVIENALDRVVMLLQRLWDGVRRSMRLPDTASDSVSTVLPVPTANNFIGWDSNGTALRNVDPNTLATVVAFAAWQSQAFSGDGVTTQFTLSSDPGNVNNLDVVVGAVPQRNNVDFTLSGTTLTFDVAPANGLSIFCRWGQALPEGTSTLQARLFSVASALDGPGLVKASQALTYAAGTFGAKYNEVVSIKDHPFLAAGGGADATAAIQAAFAKLGTSPGIVVVPPDTYKITGKVSCYAGQCLYAYGAVFDVSAYDGVFLSYNEANTFSFTNYYPPTLIAGGKVMGKVGTPGVLATFNPNFVFVKVNRTPYVTVRDLTCYYAAPVVVLGESILCTLDSVRSYNPISNSFTFALGSGGFGPNNSSMRNCHVEEQKYPCSGIRIDSGGINIADTYLESLSTGIHFNGGYAALTNTVFGLRDQLGAQAMLVDQPCNLRMTGGNITFAGSAGGIAQTGFNINVACDITMVGAEVRAIDSALNTAVLFNVKAAVGGAITGCTIRRTVAGTNLTIFNLGNVAGAEYSGTFGGNFVFGDAGSTTTFSSNGGGLGTLAPTIQNNRFVRVTGFNGLNGGVIQANQFIGAASTISWAGYTPGSLGPGNKFGSAGWTVTNAAYISNDNENLTGGVPGIASASSITPNAPVTDVSGTTAISTIVWAGRDNIVLIPSGLWATNAAGNIAIGTTAVVGKALHLTYNAATSKWYPSY